MAAADMHAIRGNALDLDRRGARDPLLELAGQARFALLGEATHGTHEFYSERAGISRVLIERYGFRAVAVEADWPDAYYVNRYVRGVPGDESAVDALSHFRRFPAWMWRNADVLEFIAWLRDFNDALPKSEPKCGFYGLDLYSMYSSAGEVIDYLDKVDPEAARRARFRYGCFENFAEDTQAYGYAAGFDMTQSCEAQVIEQLVELQRRAGELARRDGRIPPDEFFFAEQNARLVKNAEEYYRSMFRGRVLSWNLRDRHMAETLEALSGHFAGKGEPPNVVVWEHNSHIGDARATELGRAGEWNVGQLMRERYPGETALIGFTAYTGTVTAASEWGGPAERKRVRPALEDSYEALFHELGVDRFCLVLRDREIAPLETQRLERAIGVVYLPGSERLSHYFFARLPDQFDAVVHFETTRAVEPLERTSQWEAGEMETFPTGF